MLRKRSRSHQKDQQNMGQSQHLIFDESCHANSDAFLKQKHKPNSFFTLPGLFVGLNPKNSESDSIRSPTSPLDFKVFSKPNLGNSSFRSSSNGGNQKSWDFNKVGLSIIESLDDEESGKILRSSDSKSILCAPQMRILKNPSLKTAFDSFSSSLPKNYAIPPHTHIIQSNSQMINPLGQESSTKFWSHSLDSTNSGSKLTNLSSVASFSASEIELSEDYTCVRKHGPNPKTTHIFGDCILERHENEFIAKSFKYEAQGTEIMSSEVPTSYVFDDFLSFCYSCKKKLEGEDIYMYRGEKAFCSWDCRSREISIEEEMEKSNGEGVSKRTPEPNGCEELFQTSMFIAT